MPFRLLLLDQNGRENDKIMEYCSKAFYSNNRLAGIQFPYHNTVMHTRDLCQRAAGHRLEKKAVQK